MRETLYAVVRHQGRWGIRVRGAEFFACDDFRVALDVALTAADLLTRDRAARRASGDAGESRLSRDDVVPSA